MPAAPEQFERPFIRDDDEGLFSRDFDGQLVRMDAPTDSDYHEEITLKIDGREVTVKKAEPLKGPDGNIIQDLNGRTKPKYTTIYDAALKLYVNELGDESKIPIPTLCHQPHMTPVAVCRLCVVQICAQKRGKLTRERKLLPACQHQVKPGMEVFTMNAEGADGDRVRSTVKMLTEMLAADHLKPVATPALDKELAPYDELGQMVQRCHADPSRLKTDAFATPVAKAPPLVGRRQADVSSPVFLINHSACVLCERCIRACDEVQENHVIGRTGKGATAGIGFDLNDLMGESGCVQCGECMVSCPTSAITFKPSARVELDLRHKAGKVASVQDLTQDPIFHGIPPKFLIWQKGLVLRRKVKKGDIVCNQGEAGNTAFLIKSGKLEATVYETPRGHTGPVTGGFLKKPTMRFQITPQDLILGEMACLSGSPRTATVTALEDGELLEIRRNVLDRLMRLPNHREKFERAYRDRALDHVLPSIDLFKNLKPEVQKEIIKFIREKITFLRVRPGQTLFRQGDSADNMYLVRRGHVRIGVRRFEREARVMAFGPGAIIGEIGLLGFSSEDAMMSTEAADQAIREALERCGGDLASAIPAGQRSATCSALGDLELAKMSRRDFLEIINRFPMIRERLVTDSLMRLRSNTRGTPLLDEYIKQGLYEGQSILTLDLDLCTRCDECTKGCVQQHGTHTNGVPVTRLLRDGLRFGNFVIATSCRSCTEAHCMVGCPVDAIHRGRHRQIVIEDHCIGCGLCADNCPYGSIFIVENQNKISSVPDPEDPRKMVTVAQDRAVTCDLCDAEGSHSKPTPRCVAACPHEAASRKTGEELFGLLAPANAPWKR